MRAAPPIADSPPLSWWYESSKSIARAVADALFRGPIAGLEHLPRRGGFMIASNHMSHLDPPIVGVRIRQQIAFFARKTLWKPGPAAWWLDAVGTIPVDRDGASDIKAIKAVLGTLRAGRVVLVFPEGTRSPDGNLQTAKPGVGLLACRTGVPVVPARVFGTFDAFGRGSSMVKPGVCCSVTYGPPLYPSDYDDPSAGKERYQRAADRIMAAISKLEPANPAVV